MGLFDSLGNMFSSGGGASTGPSIFSVLGPLISQIRTTPNRGATKGDIARAGRMNLLTGLLGGLGTYYGARQDADAQAGQMKGLFDILSKGGGEQTVEAAGPVMPGQPTPTATTKVPLSQALYAYGRDNPLARSLAMQMGMGATENERTDAYNQQKFDRENLWHSDEMGWKQKQLEAEQGYRNASLGLQREELNLRKAESKDPWKIAAKIEAVTPGAGASYITQALGGGEEGALPDKTKAPSVVSSNPMLEAINQASSASAADARLKRETPLIENRLSSINNWDQKYGITEAVRVGEQINGLLAQNDRVANTTALKLLSRIADGSVVQAGELTSAERTLISNAKKTWGEILSWGDSIAPYTPEQKQIIQNIADVYSNAAQNALRRRLEGEMAQLGAFGVSRPEDKFPLFRRYLGEALAQKPVSIPSAAPSGSPPSVWEVDQ